MEENDLSLEQRLKNVCDFYALTHRLKNLIRTGWKRWNVKADRLESVAEHIYGTQMLAFAVNSEFNLGIDIEKVILMLAFHELGEISVGDIAFIDGVSKEDKHRRELSAVLQILEPLSDKNRIIDLFNEFEERKTKEAQFAYLMDKIECDLQCKCYEENRNVSLNTEQKGVSESIRQDALEKGVKTFSEMWVGYEREKNVYRSSQLAKDITDYILSNKVFEKENDGKSDDKNGKNL